ncbi:MAG: Uma2 family endonuclease [Thermomicrobiales bacterium]|nr:Uma2 family endonuclease [Thermomicrobiales bacterium]
MAAARRSAADLPLTSDDLDALPNLEHRELINGELLVAPSPSVDHQDIIGRLYDLFGGWRGLSGAGKAFLSPLDVRLSRRDTVQPDLFFITIDRLDRFIEGRYFDGPPAIVVEVVSPTSRAADMVRKFALYERSAVPEYWLVDLANRAVHIHSLRGGQYQPMHPDGAGAVRSALLPGIVIDPASLFAKLPI